MAGATLKNHRLNNFSQKLDNLSIDGFLVTYPANVSYLCQYKIDDTYLLVSPKESFLITDFRYLEEAKTKISGFTIKKTNGSIFSLIASLSNDLGIKHLGFETKYLPYGEYDKIKEGLNKQAELIPLHDAIEGMRAIKDKYEIHNIESAVKITLETFKYVESMIKPGMREIDVCAEINRFIRANGADNAAFDIIVASGANSSMPHSKTGQKILNNNEPVLIDMGVEVNGYKSDLTRMFFLGKMPDTIIKAEEVVRAAKNKAIALLKPGAAIKDIDAAAREYIASFGWGPNFGHSLGHGIGLEVHEAPHIHCKNNSCLKAGMVFTIEPAVYFPQKFGIRLEDIAIITEKGVMIFNEAVNN